MIISLIHILELVFKVKEAMELFKRLKKPSNNNLSYTSIREAIINAAVKAKDQIQLQQGMSTTLEALKNIIVKTQDNSDPIELISDLQVITKQINTLYTEGEEIIDKIVILIKEIEILSKDLVSPINL